MSLQFVRRLEDELAVKIADLTKRILSGQLSDREYTKMTAEVSAYQNSILVARDLLRRDEDEDEGGNEDDVVSRSRDFRR